MKAEPAIVYRLSATLEATVSAGGRVVLQRNTREPLVLSPPERRNLEAALRGEGAT